MKFTFAPQSTPLPGYTIKRAIHRGGFGEVYYAMTDAGKEVALKLLNQHTDIELRGVTQCLNLKHPNLVTIFDIKTDADQDSWIVMEYVSGDNLSTVINKNPDGLPLDKVSHWLEGIVSGLSYLHDRGIVHRDLKPANIYTESKIVKIGDVGLSKFITESRRNAQSQSVGTVYYMAPEVANGRYGREVDIYSLAVMLFELITGDVPFDGESAGEILMKHLSAKPDLSPLPEKLRPVIARALTKDPQKRTSSATQLLKEFKQALTGVTPPTELPEDSFVSLTEPTELKEESFITGPPQTVVEDQQPNGIILSGKKFGQYLLAEKMRKKHRKKRKHEKRRQRRESIKRECAERTRNRKPQRTTALAPAQSSSAFKWILAVLICVAGLFLFRGGGALLAGMGRQLFIAGILGALVYVVIRLTKSTTTTAISLFNGNHQGGEVTSENEVAPNHLQYPNHVRYEVLTHETPRLISTRHRMTELTGSLTMAVLCTTIISAGLYLFNLIIASPGEIALFSGVTLIGSWGIMIFSKMFEGRNLDNTSKRLMLLLIGAAIGTAAFAMNDLFHVTTSDVQQPVLFKTVGRLNLMESGSHPRQPTLAGYGIFFAMLFAVRRWWVQADSFRKKRFRVTSVALTAVFAWLISLIWYFPSEWGVAWAATICSVVHLSSVWVPKDDRWKMVRDKNDIV